MKLKMGKYETESGEKQKNRGEKKTKEQRCKKQKDMKVVKNKRT